MKKILLISTFILMVLFSGCEKKINPSMLGVLPEDKAVSEHPVTEEELEYKQPAMILKVVSKSSDVTEARYQFIQNSLKQAMKKYGFFKIIPDEQIEEQLKTEEYKSFDPKNVADMIQLGRDFSASHIAQEEIKIISSSKKSGSDNFKAEVILTLFTAGSGQVIVKEKVEVNSIYPKATEVRLKKLIQTYLPLKGYILETRGGHQVARISLGRALGVMAGREFLVHKRELKNQFSGDQKLAFGVLQTKISYSAPIARVKVIEVMENDAWVLIDKNDRSKIRIGQAVFSRPE